MPSMDSVCDSLSVACLWGVLLFGGWLLTGMIVDGAQWNTQMIVLASIVASLAILSVVTFVSAIFIRRVVQPCMERRAEQQLLRRQQWETKNAAFAVEREEALRRVMTRCRDELLVLRIYRWKFFPLLNEYFWFDENLRKIQAMDDPDMVRVAAEVGLELDGTLMRVAQPRKDVSL